MDPAVLVNVAKADPDGRDAMLPARAGLAQAVFEQDDWFSAALGSSAPVGAARPALKLAKDGLQIVKVEAIRLKSTVLPIVRKEWPDFPDL